MANTARASCRRGWARLLPSPTKASVALTPPRAGVRRRDLAVLAALAPAAARAATRLRGLVRFQHRLALVGPGAGEAVPPVGEAGELALELAALAAQLEEIPARAVTRMLEQPVRALAGALLEARLQRPDFLDRRLEPARDRDLLRLLAQHLVHRVEQCRDRLSAAGPRGFPGRENLVPEERGEQKAGRDAAVLAHAVVRVGERQLDEPLAERLLEDHVDQRQEAVRQAVRAQAAQRLDRVAGKQQLLHFVEQPRRRDVLHQRGELRDRRGGLRVDGDAELRGEPHRAQHAHRVLAQARHRRADELEPAGADVRDASDVIPDFLLGRVEVQRVDREVAARRILGLRAVDVVRQQPPVLVGRVVAGLGGAECRDFDRLRTDVHVDEAETAADDERAAEQRLHLLRAGVGGDVEILRLDPEQEVADGAADHEGLEPRFLQPARDLDGAAGQLVAADRMVRRPVDARLPGPVLARQQAGEKAANRHAIGAAQAAGAGGGGQRQERESARGAGAAGTALHEDHRRRRDDSTRRSTDSSRQAPGASPSVVQGPTACRMRRNVGSPAAAVIRRTWRFRPSVSVISSHDVGSALRTRMGGVRGQRPAGSGIARTVAGAVTTSSSLIAGGKPLDLVACRHALDFDPVDLRELSPRARDARLQRPVGRQHDETFAVRVQPSRGIDVGNAHEVGERRLAAPVGGELAEHAVGLVQQDHRRRPPERSRSGDVAPCRAVPWQFSS